MNFIKIIELNIFILINVDYELLHQSTSDLGIEITKNNSIDE
jgi:hypothetical protein